MTEIEKTENGCLDHKVPEEDPSRDVDSVGVSSVLDFIGGHASTNDGGESVVCRKFYQVQCLTRSERLYFFNLLDFPSIVSNKRLV